MSRELTRRLQSLQDSYKATLGLIQELQTFPTSTASSDNDRIDLANEIHDTLKDLQDTLDLLRQEIDDTPPTNISRRTSNSQRDYDHARNIDLTERLTEDLKTARVKFRRAQLTAKRNADESKRHEREQLFKRSHTPDTNGHVTPSHQQQQRRQGQQPQQLTQADLARNASEDVTRALRRTHALLQSNLSQSQFAQQTLDESQDALSTLGDSYGGTSDLLKSSRGLVGQLVRSNKSDTWYLQTAFYMLAITISWLFFRRLLYGPLWWLVWQPLRMMWWLTFTALGGVLSVGRGEGVAAVSGANVQAKGVVGGGGSQGVNAKGFPTNAPGVKFKSMGLPAKGGGWGGGAPPAQQVQPDSMIEKVGKMIDDQGTNPDDLPEEERQRQDTKPRNPKKRMMEVDVESGKKDEL